METTTIKGTVKVPTVTAENLADEKSIALAINAHTLANLKAGESGIRSYGFLASVVELTEYKAKDMVETYGADKGRLSKAKACVRHVIATIIATDDGETLEPFHYNEAVEYLATNYDSLDAAYRDIRGDGSKSDPTLADMVANLYKWADKNGVDRSAVVEEVTRQK